MRSHLMFLGASICVLLALLVIHVVLVTDSVRTFVKQDKEFRGIEIQIAREQLEVAKDQLEVNKTKLVLDFCSGAGRYYDGKFECVKE